MVDEFKLEYVDPNATHAALNIGGENSYVRFTAVTAGVAGNSIDFIIANSSQSSVTVATAGGRTLITVTIPSTAALFQLRNNVLANAEAAALVTAEIVGSVSADVPSLGRTALTGGTGTNSVDITRKTVEINKFTDCGTGEIVSAHLMLDARFGDFITNDNSGATPILRQFDHLRLTVRGRDDMEYTRVLLVDTAISQKNENGTFLSVDLLGREQYLHKMYFPGHYFFVPFRDVVKDIVSYYNGNRGTEQPELEVVEEGSMSLNLAIPSYTVGIFEFGSQTTVYDALLEIVHRLSLPVAAGGAGRYYTMTFEEKDEDYAKMVLHIRPEGFLPEASAIVTLDKSIDLTRVRHSQEGNIIRVEGAPGTGSFPKEPALFQSAVIEYTYLPQWDSTTTYVEGVLVQHEGIVYISQSININSEPGANTSDDADPVSTNPNNWEHYPFRKYWGYIQTGNIDPPASAQDVQYSPWTNAKRTVHRNNCGNPSGSLKPTTETQSTNYTRTAIPDCNLVIRDVHAWRDWADVRVKRLADIPSEYLYPSSGSDDTVQGRLYHGFRILLDDSLSGDYDDVFTGRDEFGNRYQNALVQLNREGRWQVIIDPERDAEVAVFHEGKVYEWNGAHDTTEHQRRRRHIVNDNPTLGWRDNSETDFGNDCWHHPNGFSNSIGLFGNNTNLVNNDAQTAAGQLPSFRFTKSDGTSFAANSGLTYTYTTEVRQKALDAGTLLFATLASLTSLGAALALLSGTIRFGRNLINLFTADPIPDEPENPVYTETVMTPNGEVHRKKIRDEATDAELYYTDQYSHGWWSTLIEFPFPKTTYHGITENVGGLYGGTRAAKVPLLDLLNLNYTASGDRGFGHDDSELLGELDGIKFLFNFDITATLHEALGELSEIPFRCCIYDILGNVWISDTTYRFQGDTQLMDFPFSSFKIYRARLQPAFSISNAIQRIINPELRVTEVFERRLVKRVVFHCLLPYDDAGRYDPWSSTAVFNRILDANGFNARYIGTIDALHFTKTPIAIAKDPGISEKYIEATVKRYPRISNVAQLQKIATSQLDITRHQNEYWAARFQERTDMTTGDQVYLHDDDFLDEDIGTRENVRRLIVRKITYSVGSAQSNSGLISECEFYRQVGT